MLLTEGRRGAGIFRTVFYLPVVTPASSGRESCSCCCSTASNGLINEVLGLFGINGPNWLSDPDWIKPGIVIIILWSSARA